MNLDPALLDQTALNFSPTAVALLNAIIAVVVFGVALELQRADFARLFTRPRPVVAGLLSQLVALPLLSFGLIVLLQPPPSIALGMLMVASCPGGNISNVLTHWAGGRTTVSMSLTAISSLVSPLTTPLTFRLLAGWHPAAARALTEIQVPYSELVLTIGVALVAPLLAGMLVAERWPQWAARLRRPLRRFGLLAFAGFVLLALGANLHAFTVSLGAIFVIVLVHNALALATGYGVASLFRLHESERRAVTFESGIHNTALGLVLVFGFFHGLGGMALITAWWGVWHLVTGGLLARHWAGRKA